MKPAIVHSEAEFRAAIEYYEQQRAGLGGEFRATVERVVEQGARKALVYRFPYTVFFMELEATRYWAYRRPE